ATAALASRARLAEVALGRKVATPAAPAPDLATILVRTVGPLFSLMEHYEAAWQEQVESLPVQRGGGAPAVLTDGAAASREHMVRGFEIGLKALLPVWEQIMSEPTLALLSPLALATPDEFRFPTPLWARVVSDFAVAHHERRMPREHLLRALT